MNWIGSTTVTELGKLLKFKNSIVTAIALISLSGCVSVKSMPSIDEVNNIPVDCKNQQFFIRYLEAQIDINRPIWKSEVNYEATVSAIKTKIWTIRYTCQPL